MPMQQLARKPVLALGATAMIVFGASGISGVAANARTVATTPSTQQGGHGPGMDTSALASALGVSTADLEAAIRKVRETTNADSTAQRDTEVKAVADALGVPESAVQTVLDAQRPAGALKGPQANGTPAGTTPTGDHGRGGPGGGGPGLHGASADDATLVAALAKATGKSTADVRAALAKGDAVRDAARKAAAADFAKRLAAALGLDQAKVVTAIDATRSARPAMAAKQTTAQVG